MSFWAMGINLELTSPMPFSFFQTDWHRLLLLGKDFIGDDSCAMVLRDNIFYGHGLFKLMDNAKKMAEQGIATIFGYYVKDPERFFLWKKSQRIQKAITLLQVCTSILPVLLQKQGQLNRQTEGNSK